MKMSWCAQCGSEAPLCSNCHCCDQHCSCGMSQGVFDADELGLDPETDNTPNTGSRHA